MTEYECTGCANEDACGELGVRACANYRLFAWCSIDPLHKAKAERNRYRNKALGLACMLKCLRSRCPDGINQSRQCCERKSAGTYCETVIEEVDGGGR